MMDKNVQIPLSLLDQTIDFFEGLDISGFDKQTRLLYDEIFSSFIQKKMKLCLRDSYAKIIDAVTENERFIARNNYFINKRFTK